MVKKIIKEESDYTDDEIEYKEEEEHMIEPDIKLKRPRKKCDYIKTEARVKAFERARIIRAENIEIKKKEKEELLKLQNDLKTKLITKTNKKKESYKQKLKDIETESESSVEIIYKKKKPKKKIVIVESESDSDEYQKPIKKQVKPIPQQFPPPRQIRIPQFL